MPKILIINYVSFFRLLKRLKKKLLMLLYVVVYVKQVVCVLYVVFIQSGYHYVRTKNSNKIIFTKNSAEFFLDCCVEFIKLAAKY